MGREALIDGVTFTAPDADLKQLAPGLRREIHPADNMTSGATEHLYFWMGKTGLDAVRAVLGLLPTIAAPRRILDFPSGYGRVLRWFRLAWPSAEITACDIDRAGVDFCAATFDAIPIYSSMDVKQVCLPGQYDLIWVGSLFTHLTEDSACDLLALFHSAMAPGGVLIFSIAGQFVYDLAFAGEHRGLPSDVVPKMQDDLRRTGFAYGGYQAGIVQESNYGRAFIAKSWLTKKIAEYPDMRSVAYIHRGYARRQDVVAWKKSH